MVINLLLLPRFRDTQCGFKAFTRESLRVIVPRQKVMGWAFDVEYLVIAKKHKLTITQKVLPDWHDPKTGKGLVGESQIVAMIKTFREILAIWFRRLRGHYN